MARRSSIKGDFKLRGVLRRIGQFGESDLPQALAKAADMVLATQQQLIPKDTGEAAAALRVNITKANQRSGLEAKIGIIGKKDNRRFFYLRFVEYGTKGYAGKKLEVGETIESSTPPKRAGNRDRRKTNKSDGETFYGAYPKIPARPAHPWLRPSIDLNRDDIRVIISEAIASTLRRAAQGGGNE